MVKVFDGLRVRTTAQERMHETTLLNPQSDSEAVSELEPSPESTDLNLALNETSDSSLQVLPTSLTVTETRPRQKRKWDNSTRVRLSLPVFVTVDSLFPV